MRTVAMLLLLAVAPCTTLKEKVYAKVKAVNGPDGGFSLEPICPKGTMADTKHMPEDLKRPSSYADAINAMQKVECIPAPAKKG